MSNVGRVLVKKKVLMLGSKDNDMINDSDIYDTYKDLYLSEKEHEGKLLQGMQPANGLKARVCAKKSDGTALTLTTQENAIKKAFDKRFSVPLDFDLLSILCIHMALRKIVHYRVYCYYFLINVMISQMRMKNFIIQALRKF